LLIPYGSFAETQSDENYPDAIKCIVDKYVASFPKVERSLRDIKDFDSWLRHLLEANERNFGKMGRIKREKTDTTSFKIKSIENFSFGNKMTKKGFDIHLQLWTMETSMEANRLLRVVARNHEQKPPLRLFVYDGIVVMLWVRAFNMNDLLQEHTCEIIRTCFECGDIDDRFYTAFDYAEKRCGCGKAKEAEKEQK
jgi:hypothetical protein